jgi:hypothetical protein
VGTFITAGAFVPDGHWPDDLDGAYLFADGGSGQIFLMRSDGSVDYDAPWATGVTGLADMVFGTDEAGRLALYYTLNSTGELRNITWEGAGASPTPSGLAFEPVAPTRVYDTRSGLGVEAGRVRGGTTRLVGVQPPTGSVRAALVNLTVTDNAGWGFVQAWSPRSLRPATSVVNVVQPGEDVANTAVVTLDETGRFLAGTSTATHLVVDVLGWFVDGPAEVSAGRFEPVDPGRVVDTRQPAGTSLASGASNGYGRSAGTVEVEFAGVLDVPDDGTAAAAVVVLTAIGHADPAPGFVTAYAAGSTAPDASNVNTSGAGDIRANLAVVPLGAEGAIALDLVRVDHVLIDVVGYMTSESAPVSSAGLFRAVSPVRIFDERAPGTPAIAPGGSTTIAHAATVSGATDAGAVLQNLTITSTSGFDFAAAYPAGTAAPEVSNVNATAAGQTRAALAVTPYGTDASITYSQFGDAALIVDVFGIFSR